MLPTQNTTPGIAKVRQLLPSTTSSYELPWDHRLLGRFAHCSVQPMRCAPRMVSYPAHQLRDSWHHESSAIRRLLGNPTASLQQTSADPVANHRRTWSTLGVLPRHDHGC